MSFIGKNVEVNTNTLTPQAADPTVATEGMMFYADGTSRPEGVYVYKNANWVLVGSGAGELNFYEQGNADEASVSDFTTGNNATFDGGGSFQGVFSISTTAADIISGERAFKMVLNATPGTSDDDYIATTVIDIPQGYRGRFLAVKLQYKYDGADDDIKWVVKDDTNTAILTTGSETLNQYDEVNNTATELTLSFYCPADCAQIKIGPQVLTHATGSEELIWDDVIVTPNILVNGQIDEIQNIRANTANGFGSSGTKIRRFTNEEYNIGPEILTYTQDATNGDYFTVNSDCEVEITATDNFGSSTDFGISLNASSLTTNFGALAIAERITMATSSGSSLAAEVSWHGSLSAGDILRSHSQGTAGGVAGNTMLTLLATKKIDSFLTYNVSSNNSEVRLHTANGYGSSGTKIRRFTTAASNIGTSVSYVDDATNGATFTVNDTGIYQISFTGEFSALANLGISLNASSLTTNVESLAAAEVLAMDTTSASGSLGCASATVSLSKNDIIRPHTDGTASGTASLTHFSITKIGSNQLMGVPKTIIAYVKDVKAQNVSSGTFTSGADRTRDLNTLEGDTSFISLSANQFTLDPGTYDVQARAEAYRVANHKVQLYNITDSNIDILGSSSYASAANDAASNSTLFGTIIITESTIFEIRHRCATTLATNGFGSKSGVEVETFCQVKITKLN